MIELDGVWKEYVKYDDAPLLVNRMLRLRARTRRSSLWAVRDVTFTVDRGEVLGIVGRNGSGKSTLLRMMAGVTAPTRGVVQVGGRVAPLISVGVGFHQELTGRENVYVNGTILGMTRTEIDRRFDEIVDFAEIGDFIDTPVKFYSSGMFVRLGFSVAVASDPTVLIIDEVLAVGDLLFQMKCFDRMQQLCNGGASVVIVSHNLNAIRRMSKRTLVMHDAELRFDGPTADALATYHDLLGEAGEPDSVPTGDQIVYEEWVEIEGLELLGPDGQRTAYVDTGDEIRARIRARFLRDVEEPRIGFHVHTVDGVWAYGHNNIGSPIGSYRAGDRATIDIVFRAQLATQSYRLAIGLRDRTSRIEIARRLPDVHFFVAGPGEVKGVADLGARYETSGPEP